MNVFSLNNKVAIVTGAGRGNGASIAAGLLQFGATVYGMDLAFESNSSVQIDHLENGDRLKSIVVDVSNSSEMKKQLAEIYGQEHRIDVLVNNAGITKGGVPPEDYPGTFWDATLSVNLWSPFHLSQLVFPYMKHHGGSIINITSLASEMGMSNNPAYVASKGGLKLLTKAFAKDWAKHKIRVNNLGLGYFRTNMTQGSYRDPDERAKRSARILLDRWGEPDDLIGPIVFLASDASGYMTGQDLYIDGGFLADGI